MSTTSITVEQLEEIPLFRNMTCDELHHLADVVEVINFPPQEVILRQDKDSQNMWVILQGECEVIKTLENQTEAEALVLATIGQNSQFGEMSFFHSAPHSASVRAKTETEVLRLQRAAYDQLVESNNMVAYKLAFNTVESLADRLREMDRWVTQLQNDCESKPKATGSEWNRLREHLFDNWNL